MISKPIADRRGLLLVVVCNITICVGTIDHDKHTATILLTMPFLLSKSLAEKRLSYFIHSQDIPHVINLPLYVKSTFSAFR